MEYRHPSGDIRKGEGGISLSCVGFPSKKDVKEAIKKDLTEKESPALHVIQVVILAWQEMNKEDFEAFIWEES